VRAYVVVMAAVLGLAMGSFLNVVLYRLPRGLSVVRPRSRCPGCGTTLHSVDNIPVLSWLLLRGRCRTCRCRISIRYPLVEATTGLLLGLLALLVTR
jgi:leader peptidase (prepilin peptidase)/N-methyltransferase